jgi:hypothetical protein
MHEPSPISCLSVVLVPRSSLTGDSWARHLSEIHTVGPRVAANGEGPSGRAQRAGDLICVVGRSSRRREVRQPNVQHRPKVVQGELWREIMQGSAKKRKIRIV